MLVQKERINHFPSEISIADFHLAKKTLEGENIQTKKEQFLYVLVDLLSKAKASFDIKTVIFPFILS